MTQLPELLQMTLTWGRELELAVCDRFSMATDMEVHFSAPAAVPGKEDQMKIHEVLMLCKQQAVS